MTTTRILIVGLIAGLALAGCAPQPGPVFIDKFFAVPSSCEVDEPDSSEMIPGAVLDVAAYPVEYWIGISMKGGENVKTPPVSVGSLVLEPSDRARPIIDEMVVAYSSPSPSLRGFKDWKRGLVIQMAQGGAHGAFQLISPEAADIIDNVEPSNDPHDRTRLDVAVTFNGYISGTNSRFTTGPMALPLTLVRTDSACTRYSTLASGPCAHPGMSGEALVCCTSTSDPGCQ